MQKLRPRDKTGTTFTICDWKLSALIDAASKVKRLGQDVKQFSHVLRDFRNYMHPYQ